MDLNVCTQCHVLHVCPSRDLKARSYRRTFCLNYQAFFSLNFLFFHIFLFFFAPILECEDFQIFCPLLKRGKFGKECFFLPNIFGRTYFVRIHTCIVYTCLGEECGIINQSGSCTLRPFRLLCCCIPGTIEPTTNLVGHNIFTSVRDRHKNINF